MGHAVLFLIKISNLDDNQAPNFIDYDYDQLDSSDCSKNRGYRQIKKVPLKGIQLKSKFGFCFGMAPRTRLERLPSNKDCFARHQVKRQ